MLNGGVMASAGTIEVDEAAELLRRIARGDVALTPVSPAIVDAAIVAVFCADRYVLYLFKDDEGPGTFECLVREEGWAPDVGGWFVATGQLPLELLTEIERMQLEEVISRAVGTRDHSTNGRVADLVLW